MVLVKISYKLAHLSKGIISLLKVFTVPMVKHVNLYSCISINLIVFQVHWNC